MLFSQDQLATAIHRVILWVKALCCLFVLSASAMAHADYRDTPVTKIRAAVQYAHSFLQEDARPGQQFFQRVYRYPDWKDKPMIDCSTHAIMRAYKTDSAYFEDSKKTVVIVPVWVELLMLEVNKEESYLNNNEPDSNARCKMEYEHYSFATQRFEKLPEFQTKPYFETFKNWGELAPNFEIRGSGYLAIAPDQRYVRFNFRISVAREAPYQLYPQFPRHHPALPSILKLEETSQRIQSYLDQGKSTWNSEATGERLDADLKNMRRNLYEMQWALQKLRQTL